MATVAAAPASHFEILIIQTLPENKCKNVTPSRAAASAFAIVWYFNSAVATALSTAWSYVFSFSLLKVGERLRWQQHEWMARAHEKSGDRKTISNHRFESFGRFESVCVRLERHENQLPNLRTSKFDGRKKRSAPYAFHRKTQ
jgi:hypothetical protein